MGVALALLFNLIVSLFSDYVEKQGIKQVGLHYLLGFMSGLMCMLLIIIG